MQVVQRRGQLAEVELGLGLAHAVHLLQAVVQFPAICKLQHERYTMGCLYAKQNELLSK